MKPKHLAIPLATTISLFGSEALSDYQMLPELVELAQLTKDNVDKALVCTGMSLSGDIGMPAFFSEYSKDVQLADGQQCSVTYQDKMTSSRFTRKKCFNPNDPELQKVKDQKNYEISKRTGDVSDGKINSSDRLIIDCKNPEQRFTTSLRGFSVDAYGQGIPKSKTKKVRECTQPWKRTRNCKKITRSYEYFPEASKRKIKELLRQKATQISARIRERN